MTLRTYKIELRVDFDDETKNPIIEAAMRMAGKHVLTSAMLLADKRAPTIALWGGDMFEGEKEINLADDIPQDDPPVTSEVP